MSTESGTLGKYQIIREIARSNDIVYEAYDPIMNRRVAVKELALPTGVSDKQKEERVNRFQREARAAGSLAHPNIVTIYEVGEDNGRYFIAMEYLEGQTLRQRLDVEGFLPQDEAVRIICEVLDGLGYAHDKGIIHRDVKPENIQLLPDGRVKLTDFGIARLTFEPTITVDGQIFGSPSYMSPEQVVGRELSAATDVFSSAIVLYEAISGQKPFVGDNVVSISHAIMHYDPPDPQQASFSVAQAIRKAMDKSPQMRYQSAREMSKELRSIMESLKNDPTVAPFGVQMPTGLFGGGGVATPNPQAPYDPYGSPYGQQSQQQPPPQQSYPYGSPYGQPYGTPSSGQPPPSFPSPPYPPGWTAPPKQPLLSPAAQIFLIKTFLVVLVGSILIAGGIFLVSVLNTTTERQQKVASDERRYAHLIDAAIASGRQNPTAGIDQLMSVIPLLSSDVVLQRAMKALSELHVIRGVNSIESGDWNAGYYDFMRAMDADTNNPLTHYWFGITMREMAASEVSISKRIDYYQKARTSLVTAMDLQKGTNDETNTRKEAAITMMLLAEEYLLAQNSQLAILELERAIATAPADSQEYKLAQDRLRRIER